MREIVLNTGEEVLIKAKCGKCARNESLLSSAILVIASLLSEKFEQGVSINRIYDLITKIDELKRVLALRDMTLEDLREEIYNNLKGG